MLNLFEALRHAEEIARRAGAILLEHFEHLDSIELKGHGDPVTEADLRSEQFIREALHADYPTIPMLGEEGGFAAGESSEPAKACWVVDPLDGTANYAARVPIFAVSIALLIEGTPAVGVVYDPTRDDLFSAARGEGCRRNGKRCHVSDRPVSDGIAPVAISADIVRARPTFLTQIPKGRSIGSAALQIAYVAAGLYDAALDPLTKLWDVAAGWLLVQEAGGVATRWDGTPMFPIESTDPAFQGKPCAYLVSNGRSHETLLEWTKDGFPGLS